MGLFQWGAPKWWLSLSLCIEVDSLQKWLTVKNRITEEHGIQVCFSAKLNSYLSACRYVYKNGQGVAHSENHPPALLTATSPRTKSQLQDFVLAVPQKESPQKKNFLVDFRKSEKDSPSWIYQNVFEKGVSTATLSFLLLLWSGELLPRWILHNSDLNEMKKNTPWICYQNLTNGINQRKTRSTQRISNWYSEETFEFWLC